MAKLAAISPTTHHLFFSQTSQLPASAASSFAAGRVHKVEACRQTLTQARPAVLVMICSHRFHQLLLAPLPPAVAVQHAQFLVGKAPFAPSRHQHLILPGGTP